MSRKRQTHTYVHLARAAVVATPIILIALLIGVVGYHYLAGFAWLDALLNASMILSGMGPVGELKTPAAKLFASFYALFSGLVIVSVTGIILSPLLHAVLHKFHADERDLES